jgi:PRTRC genetic system protein B
MNDITENLVKNYIPKLAIVVYTPTNSDREWNECYLESHAISEGKLMAGKPLKADTIEAMVDVFFDEQQNRAKVGGYIPENLLFFTSLPGGHYKIVWYTPAQRKYLHFVDALKIPSGEAWVPPMVWEASRKSLSVYALAIDVRPDPETELCKAPFHNVGMGGIVCLGSAKVSKPTDRTYESVMKYWEDMFWLSEFTHLQGGDSITRTNVNMLWKKLIKDKTLKWDTMNELMPIGNQFKLKKILK